MQTDQDNKKVNVESKEDIDSQEYNGSFTQTFKQFNETDSYNTYKTKTVSFDANSLEISNVTDIHEIIQEINALSFKIYYYGSLYDSQARVLQQLEDEFERWKAELYFAEKLDEKQFKTEKSKERYIFNKFKNDFIAFQTALSTEKYKLSLLQRVVRSLEGYGYKLHDLKEYNLVIEKNS